MKGDFSRLTFRPRRHFSSVRLQQGRVQLDAEWNEQVDIAAHRDETATRDIIGLAGAPMGADGFAVGSLVVPRRYQAVAFPSASAGFAVGDDATILATTDGGATWTAQAAPAGLTAHLRAVAFPSATAGFAVGDDATILATTDGGATWTAQAAPAGLTAHLRAVAFPSASAGFAVGDDATILATTDGGATWTAQAAPAGLTAHLRAVAFPSASAGFAVGDDATILATTDGGATWTAQAAPAGLTAHLRAVAFPSASAGFAVGDDATILATTDGGATWTAQAAPAGLTAHLRAVAFPSASAGFAVGDDATILATTDGGATWTAQAAPAGLTAHLRAVAFPSASAGFAVGDDATILATTDGGATWTAQAAPAELGIGAGRMYVDGILAENDVDLAFGAQPDPPGLGLPQADGRYLFYLDVWQRHLSAVERPELREVALGGPDTATRTQTVWQVRWESADGKVCADFGPDWAAAKAGSTGRLAGRATPSPAATDPCEVPPGAGYRRLENQLYRVEIHDPSSGGTPTFKWSRDNGSVLAKVEGADASAITISGIQKDGVAGFGGAAFAEVRDEERELAGTPGDLVPITVQGAVLTLGAGAILAPRGSNPTVRRWESGPTAVGEDAWLELEDGVEIRFAPGDFRNGDYWVIPARTVTGTVEWPNDEFGPLFDAPHGIRHRFVALGLLDKAATAWTVADDCRPIFPPLTELVGLFCAGGDGQESLPGRALAQELRVWAPVAGSRVRFTAEGNGVVATTPLGAETATVQSLIVTAGDDRVAACGWRLDPGGEPSQVLTATLIDRAGDPFGVPIVFDAGLSLASQVAYDPTNCDNLASAGVTTVQEAIDVLCKTQGADEGIHIGRVTLPGAGLELRNDALVPVEALRKGIEIELDGPVDPEAVKDKPIWFVTIEMPYPLLDGDRHFWGDPPVVAFQPLVLSAEVFGGETTIDWLPGDATLGWLARVLGMMKQLGRGDRLLARLTLQGNFVWSTKDEEVWIDGDLFGARGGGRTELFRDGSGLMSGDGRRGGDFRMWFWLVPGGVPNDGPRLDVFDIKEVLEPGRKARATVLFTAPAPPDGIQILVKTDNPDVLKVPEEVRVEAGKAEAVFMVTAGELPLGEPTAVTVEVDALGETRAAQVTVTKPVG